MRAIPALFLPILLAACATGPQPSEEDANVEYLYAAVTDRNRDFWEVSVRIANPTEFIGAERYAACVIAAEAKARGDVWIQRMRGTRRISGTEEDLVVLYRTERLREPEGEIVFTAALTLRLCELDGIPTEPRSIGQADTLPPLALPGPDRPEVIPNLTATALPPEPEDTVLPEPAPPPPEDPLTGI